MQNQDTYQSLQSNLPITEDLTKLTETIQSIIPVILGVGAVLSLIIFVYILATSIHKWRVQSAILRIDKNLQKLVESSEPKSQNVFTEPPAPNTILPGENK
jgi:uncharacterized membrane protein